MNFSDFSHSSDDRLLRFFAASERWPVEQLDMYYPEFGDDVLAGLHQRFHLRKLFVSGDGITDRGMIHLAKCRMLEEVVLEGCSISDEGVKLIAQCPRLVDVSLRNTAVGDRGIAELTRCRSLRRINVSRTKVTVASAETFRKLPRLQELHVDQCPGIRPEDHAAFHDLGLDVLWLDGKSYDR